jgi:hypothetical protein
MVRQMFDKRALRKKFGDSFKEAIRKLDKDCVDARSRSDQQQRQLQSSNVFARKRPLFEHETAAGEFDVVRALHDGVMVHGCMMRANLKQPFLATYFADVPCFNETTSTETVIQTMGIDQVTTSPAVGKLARHSCLVWILVLYATTYNTSIVLSQLVRSSLQGATNAFCCFGQTGSGKTYTMRGILKAVGEQLFSNSDGNQSHQYLQEQQHGQGLGMGGNSSRATVAIRCYEVCGRNCHDLLEKRASVKVLTDLGGMVQVGATGGSKTADYKLQMTWFRPIALARSLQFTFCYRLWL